MLAHTRPHTANITNFPFNEYLCFQESMSYFLLIQFLELALNFFPFIHVSFRLKAQ